MGAYKYKRKKNVDPENPFTPGTIRAAFFEEDFSDLTAYQISEIFDVPTSTVYSTANAVFAKTGKVFVYKKSGPQILKKGERE